MQAKNNTIFNNDSWLNYFIRARLIEKASTDSMQHVYMPFYLNAEECLLNIEKGYAKKPNNNRNNVWFAKLEINFRITNSIAKSILQNNEKSLEVLKYYVRLLTRSNSLAVQTCPTDRKNISDEITSDFVLALCIADFKIYILYYEPFYKAKYALAKILFEKENFKMCSGLLINSNQSKIDQTIINGLFELRSGMLLMKVGRDGYY